MDPPPDDYFTEEEHATLGRVVSDDACRQRFARVILFLDKEVRVYVYITMTIFPRYLCKWEYFFGFVAPTAEGAFSFEPPFPNILISLLWTSRSKFTGIALLDWAVSIVVDVGVFSACLFCSPAYFDRPPPVLLISFSTNIDVVTTTTTTTPQSKASAPFK